MEHTRRNLIIFFVECIIFVCGMAFISIAAVIPYFLDEMGASTFAIGLSGAMTPLMSLLTGPVFAAIAAGLPYKKRFYVNLLMIQRWSFLLYALLIPILAPNMPLTVVLFLVAWALFNTVVASYEPFYYTLFVKCVPLKRQGDLRGYSCLIAYLLAIPMSFLVGFLMDALPSPYSYTVIFATGALFLIANAAFFGFLKEPPDEQAHLLMERPKFLQSYKGYLKAWQQDKHLRFVWLGNLMLFTSVSFVVYYTMYAKWEHGAGPYELSIFMSIGMALTALGSALAGFLVNKWGNGRVLLLAGGCSVLSGIVLMFVPHLIGVYIGYGLTMLATSAHNICAALLVIRQSTPAKIAVNTGLNFFLCKALTGLLLLTGAPIVDAFAFMPVFFMVSAAGALSVVFYLTAGLKGIRG